MIGSVTAYILDVISAQVADHGLVVWYDPAGDYRGLVADLALPETTIVRYHDSFFALRDQVEPLLGGLEVAGVVLKPGAQPPSRNTRLSIVARHALAPCLGEADAVDIEHQVEAGKLSLADLDRLAGIGPGGVVSVIFGTGIAHDVALAFLGNNHLDGEIAAKHAVPELSALLGPAFGLELPADETPADLRARLARHILATDLLATLHGGPP